MTYTNDLTTVMGIDCHIEICIPLSEMDYALVDSKICFTDPTLRVCPENMIDTAQVGTLQNIRIMHNRRICFKKKKNTVQMACTVLRVVTIFEQNLNREPPKGICNACAYF